jgi:hypothetical protein
LRTTKINTLQINFLLSIGVLTCGISFVNGNLTLLLPYCLLFSKTIFRSISNNKFLRNLNAFALLWALTQLLSNWIHGTRLLTIPVALGPIGVIVGSALYSLHERFPGTKLKILQFGCMGLILFRVLDTSLLLDRNYWKFVLGTPISLLIIVTLYRVQRTYFRIIIIALLAVFSIINDARALALILLTTALLLLLLNLRKDAKKIFSGKLIGMLLLFIAILYPFVADSGFLGQRVMIQQQLNNDKGERFNYILAARIELPQTLYLFTRHPLLGIGSYAIINTEENAASIDFVSNYITVLNVNQIKQLTFNDKIVTGYNGHTQIGASMLYGGVLVLPFWILFLRECLRMLNKSFKGETSHNGIIFFYFAFILGDIFFSPIVSYSYLTLGIAIFLIAVEKQSWVKPN